MLFTRPGERVNRPDFGSGIEQLVFAPADGELAHTTKALVQGALQRALGELLRVEDVIAEAEESTLARDGRLFAAARRRPDRRARAGAGDGWRRGASAVSALTAPIDREARRILVAADGSLNGIEFVEVLSNHAGTPGHVARRAAAAHAARAPAARPGAARARGCRSSAACGPTRA